MALRTFLLCSDEKALDAVTQILAELEVAVEHFHDPTFAMRRLAQQRYDAILVDCDNVDTAALIFNSLRTSSPNHNVTTIAIIDGKAGVPTAFRLGAKLVLTKPVSLEQVRSTMRNALALQKRDHDGKAFGAAAATSGHTPAIPLEVAASQTHATGPIVAKGTVPAATTMAAANDPISSLHNNATAMPEAGASPRNQSAPVSEATPPPAAVKKPATTGRQTTKAVIKDEPARVGPHAEVAGPTFGMLGESRTKTKSKTTQVAAILLLAAGAGFYATYTLTPDFRDMVNSIYSQASNQVAGLLGTAPTTVSQLPPTAGRSAAPQTLSVPPGANPSASTSAQTSTSAGSPQGVNGTANAAAEGFVTGQAAPAAQGFQNAPQPTSAPTSKAGGAPALVQTSASQKPNPTSGLISVPEEVADAHVAYRVRPDYPERLRRKTVQGSVVLLATVKADGTVDSVQLMSGNPQLSPLAADAVKQWRYEPYFRNRQATAFQTQVTVEFSAAHAKSN